MPYITIKQPPRYYQMSFDDIMAGITDLRPYLQPNLTSTRTYWAANPNPKLLHRTNINRMVRLLTEFNQSKEALSHVDRASLYHSFHIPKAVVAYGV